MPLLPGGWRAKYLELLTRGWLQLGRRRKQRSAAEHAGAVAARPAWVWRGVGAACLSGRRARAGERRGRRRGARLGRALRSRPAPRSKPRCRDALAGRALARAGDGERAVEELQRAIAVFEERGCAALRLDAERELRKLGHAIHRRTPAGQADEHGIASLSARELELARLVVDRKTNPEIAAALFLSQKTVESHLRNIFRKLDVSSRVELARAIEREARTRRALGSAGVRRHPFGLTNRRSSAACRPRSGSSAAGASPARDRSSCTSSAPRARGRP